MRVPAIRGEEKIAWVFFYVDKAFFCWLVSHFSCNATAVCSACLCSGRAGGRAEDAEICLSNPASGASDEDGAVPLLRPEKKEEDFPHRIRVVCRRGERKKNAPLSAPPPTKPLSNGGVWEGEPLILYLIPSHRHPEYKFRHSLE